ncbi:hypothetical protein FQJ88_12060 [Xanthomonas vasicola]|uniref:Uncharacterized protein n=1 Tax=Xanthomonas vasicola TaxID=56459 RepID=A0ABD7S7U9_XANVA|nr:hypothetical protein NX81_000235 [Xanthomonas vasicola]AZR29230.1 hypothetical protein KWO_000245 [Xanthomonas vasicola pv. musacearum NCPPB 4379]RRJ36022.1 hypothetical protein EIM46_20595 [Xanthomonas vasicola pv. musacearum]RRJ58596.1 hypothetical protein EIM45_18140 [Xanthomonas vasicola pv. musacearum]TWQ26398.1 hypothetical protein FQJ97_00245 [Xanthomonas vasicola]
MSATGATGEIADTRSATTTGAVCVEVTSGAAGATLALSPTGEICAMGATCADEEGAGTASAGAAAAVAITVGPAAAARASSNAERRHSNGTVVWIM